MDDNIPGKSGTRWAQWVRMIRTNCIRMRLMRCSPSLKNLRKQWITSMLIAATRRTQRLKNLSKQWITSMRMPAIRSTSSLRSLNILTILSILQKMRIANMASMQAIPCRAGMIEMVGWLKMRTARMTESMLIMQRMSTHEAHVDHTGHEQMFRKRFWVSLALSVPVILYNSMIQEWFHFSMPAFPGVEWIVPLFAGIVFIYGGLPFLRMAVPEIQNRRPGMMTLISLAISVAFFYSLSALFLPGQSDFFWKLVTLIDIMLLGHWLEMRSVRQASGALNELAKLYAR